MDPIVIDSNVWIRRLQYPGGSDDQAIELAKKSYRIVQSPETLRELEYKLKVLANAIGQKEAAEYLKLVRNECQVRKNLVSDTSLVIADRSDLKYVELALSCGAMKIISNDAKHLHNLKQVQPSIGLPASKNIHSIQNFQGIEVCFPDHFVSHEQQRFLRQANSREETMIERMTREAKDKKASTVQPKPPIPVQERDTGFSLDLDLDR